MAANGWQRATPLTSASVSVERARPRSGARSRLTAHDVVGYVRPDEKRHGFRTTARRVWNAVRRHATAKPPAHRESHSPRANKCPKPPERTRGALLPTFDQLALAAQPRGRKSHMSLRERDLQPGSWMRHRAVVRFSDTARCVEVVKAARSGREGRGSHVPVPNAMDVLIPRGEASVQLGDRRAHCLGAGRGPGHRGRAATPCC